MKGLLEELDNICEAWIQLGMIMGDLNTIFDPSHLEGGSEVTALGLEDRCDWMTRNSLGFPKSQDHFFS